MSVYVGFKLGKAIKHQAYISEYYCGGCGYPVSDHDSFCPECGGAFRKEDATERTCKMVEAYCSNCGCPDPSNGDAAYCAYCGAKVVDE